ncbi:uncharacterized protein [Panulirus ornatus]|uniref:uncharacterized protein n=1 Tax=Panulirus ornatus TaxID=150431 RepID=UPI003A87AE39
MHWKHEHKITFAVTFHPSLPSCTVRRVLGPNWVSSLTCIASQCYSCRWGTGKAGTAVLLPAQGGRTAAGSGDPAATAAAAGGGGWGQETASCCCCCCCYCCCSHVRRQPAAAAVAATVAAVTSGDSQLLCSRVPLQILEGAEGSIQTTWASDALVRGTQPVDRAVRRRMSGGRAREKTTLWCYLVTPGAERSRTQLEVVAADSYLYLRYDISTLSSTHPASLRRRRRCAPATAQIFCGRGGSTSPPPAGVKAARLAATHTHTHPAVRPSVTPRHVGEVREERHVVSPPYCGSDGHLWRHVRVKRRVSSQEQVSDAYPFDNVICSVNAYRSSFFYYYYFTIFLSFLDPHDTPEQIVQVWINA